MANDQWPNDGVQRRNGHLQLALQYTNDAWFPVNPEAVQALAPLLSDPEGIDWRERVLAEVKSDASLFSACVRDLALQANPKAMPENPCDLFRKVAVKDLHWVVSRGAPKISRHGFTLEEWQRARLMESIVSVSAAETLAQVGELNTETAYACAQMRQLGLSLVGWNYPHVFRRASGLLKKQQTLDEVIGKILGFSPSSLASSFARRWGLPANFVELIESREASPPLENAKDQKLAEMVVLSDKLARTAALVTYPDKDQEWDEVRSKIDSLGGISVWSAIAEKIAFNCRNYIKSIASFTVPTSIVGLLPPKKLVNRGLFEKNEYIKLCPPEFQHMLEQCYALIRPSGISKEAVDLLCQVLLPRAGFYRGCLYFVDPSTKKLAPRIPVGESRLADFEAMDEKDATNAISGSIAKALASSQPKQIEAVDSDGDPITCFACRLGVNQYVGALRLERRGAVIGNEAQNIMVIIKAIKIAFQEALKVY